MNLSRKKIVLYFIIFLFLFNLIFFFAICMEFSYKYKSSFFQFVGFPFHYFYNTFEHPFDVIKENKHLDLTTKLAALKVCKSIVSLVSHSGEKRLFVCSGTIIECEEESNGTFCSTILTSATLLRCPSGEAAVAPDIRVDVYLSSDGKFFEGLVFAFDFHYNIATVKIRSKAPLPTAILRHSDDSMLLNPCAHGGPGERVVDSSSFQLRHHVDKTLDSNLFKLCPGDRLVALGRHYVSYELMAAPGEFGVGCCDFDCQELFMASCRITKSGIGGPIVNRYGEVIGINFFHLLYTPFLPINVTSKCLDDLRKHGRVRRPWLGMKVTNLYAIDVDRLEIIVQKFPSICKGVIVEEVISKSPAHCAGICPNDVIVQCGGKDVGCFSEFFGIMWDKTGESMEVVVKRASVATHLNLTVVVGEADEYHEWPVIQ